MSVDAGWHASRLLHPGSRKRENALGIDAVREVTEKLNEHARLGGAKVVWVTDAALLTDAAANALLKTLEEPPAETWFSWLPASLNVYWQHYVVVVGYITLRRRRNSTP